MPICEEPVDRVFAGLMCQGVGLWMGAQSFINFGVNLGVLPTKGLTLPLMSYGRSSMIVTLTWVGLLLRVYHEAMQGSRGMATGRRSANQSDGPRATRALEAGA
jgi:cell division protein FtsW (lipid II flippase)